MGRDSTHDTIIILDFGSQYTQLIARRIRALGVYCKIFPYNTSVEILRQLNPRGLIFSGGPASVYDDGAPRLQVNYSEILPAPYLEYVTVFNC